MTDDILTDDILDALPRFFRVVIEHSAVRISAYNYTDIDNMPGGVEDRYDNVNDLPDWIAKKLAVLSMIDPDEHPTPNIKGVGRRINRSVYWIYY
jgi:hypothetical protein